MKLRTLLVLAGLAALFVLVTRRPPVVKPQADRGIWVPVANDQ
ncbi:MAG: hypothetical protein OXF41_17160 [bacterium]|nr:hypothetical protein [bacterium]